MWERQPEATAQALSAFSCPADLLSQLTLLAAHAAGTGAAEKGAASGGK